MDIQKFKSVLIQIYGQESITVETQFARYNTLMEDFTSKFDNRELHFFSTPGRTEIGGNHTDHNHGRVIAGSINLDSIAVAAKNQEDRISIYSEGYKEPFLIDLKNLEVDEKEKGTTTSLIRGIAARLKQLGYHIGGFDACMTSDVLIGSGLSSSASMEVLIGTIFNTFFNNGSIPPEVIAIIGQYAENKYFGKPCGLMDQVACAMGGIITIDFKNPGDPVIKKVDFNFDAQNYNILVVDTGGTHADLTDDYASIPADMKSVAQFFGQEVCRGITLEDLISNIKNLRIKAGDRALLRSLHFIEDNERVVDQVRALENGNFKLFLDLVKDSGNSSYKRLQNIYTARNTYEQGVALALALSENYIAEINEGACRVHGGGFAGTIQIFLPANRVKKFIDLMDMTFGENSVHVLKIRALGTIYLNKILKN
ncbi:MAG: hypothetical protein J7L04_10940 [Bacteroidales bacterium]|nr:hypothetical protein [Bacteroidales bacterium]